MKDQSYDLSHHERTLLSHSHTLLLVLNRDVGFSLLVVVALVVVTIIIITTTVD